MKLITPSQKLWVPRHARGAGLFGGSRLGLLAAGTPLTKSDGTPILCSDNATPAVANGTDTTGCCPPPVICAACTSPQPRYLVTISGTTPCSGCAGGFSGLSGGSLVSGTLNGTYCASFISGDVTSCAYYAPISPPIVAEAWTSGGCTPPSSGTVESFNRLALIIANGFAEVLVSSSTSPSFLQIWCAVGTSSQPVDCNTTFFISARTTICGGENGSCGTAHGLFTGGIATVTPNGC